MIGQKNVNRLLVLLCSCQHDSSPPPPSPRSHNEGVDTLQDSPHLSRLVGLFGEAKSSLGLDIKHKQEIMMLKASGSELFVDLQSRVWLMDKVDKEPFRKHYCSGGFYGVVPRFGPLLERVPTFYQSSEVGQPDFTKYSNQIKSFNLSLVQQIYTIVYEVGGHTLLQINYTEDSSQKAKMV